uniref:3CxxC-type domain-containing protein n=1 Tax=Denticeps clupeoides TaxID=299321 RepID=A0AAY4BDY6_9TELE
QGQSPPGDTRDWIPSLWSDTFSDMMEDELDYGDDWTFQFNYSLSQETSSEERRRGWRVYTHCAFGQFRCGTCSKLWRSARAVLLFRYRRRGGAQRGTVIMRPLGQACGRCRDVFELPGFREREVEETLERLFAKIRKNYEEDDASVGSERVRTRPHRSDLCEACQSGICCQD